jgi:hypothetical protein
MFDITMDQFTRAGKYCDKLHCHRRDSNQGPSVSKSSVLPLPVGTRVAPTTFSKKSIDFHHEIMENEKKE